MKKEKDDTTGSFSNKKFLRADKFFYFLFAIMLIANYSRKKDRRRSITQKLWDKYYSRIF
ncbi:hypothetical protein PGB90_007833 [Kerria lacca]